MFTISPKTDPRAQESQRGNAIFISLVMTFMFMSVTFSLITTTTVNTQNVRATVDYTRARFAALSAINLAHEEIEEALLSQVLEIETAGNLSGVARSIDEPGQAPLGTPPLPNSVEETLAQVAAAAPGSPLPSANTATQLPDGFFAVRSRRLPNGAFRVNAYGKWRRTEVRINAILNPVPATPFKLGMYGKNGVIVSGPGKIDWINSDNPNDQEVPIVLESGTDLIVDKTPEGS